MFKEVLGFGFIFLWVLLFLSRVEEIEVLGICLVVIGSIGGLQLGFFGFISGRRQLQKQKVGMRGCFICILYGFVVLELRVYSRNYGLQFFLQGYLLSVLEEFQRVIGRYFMSDFGVLSIEVGRFTFCDVKYFVYFFWVLVVLFIRRGQDFFIF